MHTCFALQVSGMTHAVALQFAVAAVVAAMKGEAPPLVADEAPESDTGTAKRRSRAARLANALSGPEGWAGSEDGGAANWGITGDSRYAKMRKALREEAAARLAAAQGAVPATAQ
jgi:hypothetical protein